MKRFKSIRHAQRFLSAFSGISPHFRPRRHLLSAADYRQVMADRFRSGTRSPARRPRPPPESATGTGCFVQATAHHHIGQLGWLKLTMPAQGFCQWNAHEHRLVVSRAKTAASPTPSVTRAHDAAVIRDDAAAVAVDEAEDELFGGLVDERLLPGLQSNRSHVLLAGTVLGRR